MITKAITIKTGGFTSSMTLRLCATGNILRDIMLDECYMAATLKNGAAYKRAEEARLAYYRHKHNCSICGHVS